MSAISNRTEPQPLAVELARERFRQQAMADLLTRMRTDPDAVSHDFGQELWLKLTQSSYGRLKQESASGLSTDELLEAVRADLNRECNFFLERDRQGDGLLLKINTSQWFLIAKPGVPVWIVFFIGPQTLELRETLTGLPWRLIAPGHDANEVVSPLPLWLLAQAQLRDRELQLVARCLQKSNRPDDERSEAVRLRRMREKLPDGVEDLRDAFRLLQWERQQRARRSWPIVITPLVETAPANARCSYFIEQGKPDVWPQRSLRFALGSEPRARRVDVAPDPDSPSRWLLHGPAALAHELTLFELLENEYRRQSSIADRLANPWMIHLEDSALAATQIEIPTSTATTPEFRPLPGEAPWEPRQREALLLALAGHPICAVKGPPGTGKSTVIVGIIRRAIHAGQRVLLVAPTHVALDEVLGRIHDLREKNLERAILPARIAPSDERRAQIRPELEEYIVRRLGRTLARTCMANIRTQLSALRDTNDLEREIGRLADTAGQFRKLDELRHDMTSAEQQQSKIAAALRVAHETAKVCHISLDTAKAAVNSAKDSVAMLTFARQRFADIEPEFSSAREALNTTQKAHSEGKTTLEYSQKNLADREASLKKTETTLNNARSKEQAARPGDWWGGHLWESVFSAHHKAVEGLQHAEKQREEDRKKLQAATKAFQEAQDKFIATQQTLSEIRKTLEDIESRAEGILAPARMAIVTALGDNSDRWVSKLPASLSQADARCLNDLKLAVQRCNHAEQDLARSEESCRSSEEAHEQAKAATNNAKATLAAFESELRQDGIRPPSDPEKLASKLDQIRAEKFCEFQRSVRRRDLLLRWREFYEHEDGDEQITAWALKSVNLVAATTQGIASSPEFREHEFDLVICDESSRVTRGEILVPADRATRIVLVGDEKQLPPYVEADDEQLIHALATIQLSESRAEALPEMAQRLCEAWNVDEPEFRPVRVEEVCERARTLIAGGALPDWPASTTETSAVEGRLRAWREVADALTGSCFDHLLGLLPAKSIVRLSVQRRMVAEIATLVSEPVYGGDYQSPEALPVAPLLTEAFRHAWIFFNTRSYCAARREFRENRQGTGFINEGEARAVVLALQQHVASARRTGKPVSLMAITFYLAQARHIESLVRKDKELRREPIAILPIDRCQGQEADAVVVSFVRTLRAPCPNAGRWLQDVRRLNVAFTRARHSLVLIGNLQTLTALRGDTEGEKLLDHLGRCVGEHQDHQIEQLHGL